MSRPRAVSIESDRRVFENLKTTLGDPLGYGAALLHRRYAVQGDKTLTRILLPTQPATETSQVHLLAATLSAAIPAEPPRLAAAATPDGRVRLSWPATATGHQLTVAPSLATPPPWTRVPEAPTLDGGSLTLTVTPGDPAGFYRLDPIVAP